MSEFSRETLLNIIETDHVQCGEASALARMALAAMDSSESVELPLDYLQGHKDGLEWAARLAEANHPDTGDWLYDDPIELAKAIRKGPDMPPAQPVADSEPVAWTDEQELRDVDRGGCGYLFTVNPVTPHADERRIILLYRHAQPAPVAYSDFEEFWSAYIHPLAQDDELKGFAWDIWCAAMLQAGNSPVIPDDWTGNDKANAALMMLDRIETVDPVDDDRIDGIKRIVRELAAAPHDTPALNSVQSVDSVADRWIPVSERMPPSRHEVLVGRWWGEKPRWCCKWATYIPGHPDSQSSGWLIPGASWTPTHWMPLPAAPQEPSLACISKRSQHLS
ncbi:DUF551 domain-containing protein [Klebsiella pneumoniae]